MKTFTNILFLAIFLCLNIHMVSAQDPESKGPTYHSVHYMKVKPGMHDDYLKLEKAWKKLHLANIKGGKYEKWVLTEVISPNGASTEYNYITRQSFNGDAQLAAHFEQSFMPKNWKSMLTPEEISLVEKTSKIRTMVKSEVWSSIDGVFAEDMTNSKVHVFNYFDFPEGSNRGKHVKMEQEIWKPIHQARIDAGDLKGWALVRLEMPFGAAMPYHNGTVDIYENMEQFLKPFDASFEKVHPGKDIDAMFEKTRAASTLVRGEVRIEIDSTN